MAVLGVLTHGFLAIPDRYGLIVAPGVSVSLGGLASVGWNQIRSNGGRAARLLGAGLAVLALGVTANALRQNVAYNAVTGDSRFSATGSAVATLLWSDGASDRTDTAYLFSPDVRLQFAIWLHLHPHDARARQLARRIRPYGVSEMADDSPFLTRDLAAVGRPSTSTRRIAVVDYAKGCHLPLAEPLAAQIGGGSAPARTRTIGRFSLSAFDIGAPLRSELKVAIAPCSLDLLPPVPAAVYIG